MKARCSACAAVVDYVPGVKCCGWVPVVTIEVAHLV
jgi:hypothetical protein